MNRPRELPMFPLGSVGLPGCGLPLRVFEPRYRALLFTALSSDRTFGTTLIERGSEVGGGDSRSSVGTLVEILESRENTDGTFSVLAVGRERLQIVEWLDDDPFPRCLAERWPDAEPSDSTPKLFAEAKALLGSMLQRHLPENSSLRDLPPFDTDLTLASYQMLSISPLGTADQRTGLSCDGPDDRYRFLIESLEEQRAVLDLMTTRDGRAE